MNNNNNNSNNLRMNKKVINMNHQVDSYSSNSSSANNKALTSQMQVILKEAITNFSIEKQA